MTMTNNININNNNNNNNNKQKTAVLGTAHILRKVKIQSTQEMMFHVPKTVITE